MCHLDAPAYVRALFQGDTEPRPCSPSSQDTRHFRGDPGRQRMTWRPTSDFSASVMRRPKEQPDFQEWGRLSQIWRIGVWVMLPIGSIVYTLPGCLFFAPIRLRILTEVALNFKEAARSTCPWSLSKVASRGEWGEWGDFSGCPRTTWARGAGGRTSEW